jgi:hypothetical protein
MLILVHVLIALASIAWITYLYLRPSARKFYPAYGLIAATLVSGTYLVISTGSPLLSSCVTGLVYLAVAGAGLLAASMRASVR